MLGQERKSQSIDGDDVEQVDEQLVNFYRYGSNRYKKPKDKVQLTNYGVG